MDASAEQSETITFLPRRRGPLLRGAVMIAAGVALGVGVMRNMDSPGGVVGLPVGLQFVLLGAAALVGWGALRLISVWRGAPQLVVGPAGLVINGLIRRRWLRWEELGPFELHGDGARWAISPSGPGPNSIRPRRRVLLRAVYRRPLAEIVGTINGWLGQGTAPAATTMTIPRRAGMPWLSVGIVALLAVGFVLELQLPATPPTSPETPSSATLLAFGADNPVRVLAGEWYRLFTAALLHASVSHLLLNSVALLVGGYFLEPLLGRAWFLLSLGVGAVAGSLMALVADPADLVGIGASGGVVGLFMTGLLASFRLPRGFDRRGLLQLELLQMLVPTLAPGLFGMADANVDNVAHYGGAVGGGLVAILLWASWPATQPDVPRQRRVRVAAGLVCGLFVLAAAAGGLAWMESPFRQMMADDTDTPDATAAAVLVARYPGDPRAWAERARHAHNAGDFTTAEHDYRTALDKAAGLWPVFQDYYIGALSGRLALTLVEANRPVEAAPLAHRACQPAPAGGDAAIVSTLQRLGLCPG